MLNTTNGICRSFANRCLAVALICLMPCIFGFSDASAQDDVGIYWDDLFTTNTGQTPTVPGAATGYLVLRNPSGSGGIIAWEACIDIEGPGTLTGFDFQGQAINAGSAPCFAVGYTTPLPHLQDIVLATFQAIALDSGPLYITLKPDFSASLPGQMSFITGDAPETLVPMFAVTGQDRAGGLNGGNPNLTVDLEELNFFSAAIGDTLIETIRISNNADTPYVIDHGFVGVCSSFSLPGGAGLITVPAMGFVDLQVLFVPEIDRQVNCEIFFDFLVDPILVQGSGEDPNISYTVSGTTNWGALEVGTSEDHLFTFLNTGNSILRVNFGLPDVCPDFTMTSGAGYHTVFPGNRWTFVIRFLPTSTGGKSCTVQLADSGILPLTVTGTGVISQSWRGPASINFGESYVNKEEIVTIPITNTSPTPLTLSATISAGCDAFTILAGGGTQVVLGYEETHHIVVKFQSAITGAFFCSLDLGTVVSAVSLTGVALTGPTTIEVSSSVLSFPPTDLGSTSNRDIFLRNVTSNDVLVNVAVAQFGADFIVTNGGGSRTLIPGETLLVGIRFLSNTLGFQNKVLNIGGGISSVWLVADSRRDLQNCQALPLAVNFGSVIAGSTSPQIIAITNNTSDAVSINPVSTSPDIVLTGSAITLQPGQQTVFTAALNASSIGPVTGTILLGDGACAPIPVSGFNNFDPATLLVSPTSIVIAAVVVGTAVDREITVTNNSDFSVPLEVKFLAPDYGFLFLSGGGALVLGAGETHLIRVRFLAATPTTFHTAISLGEYLPIIPIDASAVSVVEDCDVLVSNLNYGSLTVGDISTKSVSIINHSGSDIVITPVSDSPHFLVSGQMITIAAGDSDSFEVTYTPSSVGSHNATISLGNSLCANVSCFGQGVAAEDFSTDLLGVYWEENFIVNNTYNNPANSVIPGYLVMSTPSQTGGLSAWEAKIELQGTAVNLGWALAGEVINVGSGDEFVVGLGSPLPFTTDVVMATFNVLNIDENSVSEFHATPILQPSVPDQMSWVAGDLPNILLPIHTVSGTSLLGSITPAQIIDPAWYTVAPNAIDIPAVVVGTQIDQTIVVSNIGPVDILFDIELLQPIYGFNITAGDGLQLVAAGESFNIELRFVCLSATTYATNISLGSGLPLIPLDAIGVNPVRDCDIADMFLDFGDASLNSSRSRFIDITNTTDIPMSVTPTSSSPYFVVDNTEVFFAAGESKSIQVVFTPVAEVLYNGVINLGNALCESISCLGEGIIGEDFSADLLGIFFDPEFTQNNVRSEDNELLTGYLVITNPSSSGGVLAWECQVEWFGNAQILSWNLEGDVINLGTDNEFIVGLAAPLPFTDQTLLASFQVFNTDSEDESYFFLRPVRIASVTDQMSWIAASNPNDLLPMHTVGGEDVVAFIGPGSAVAIEFPTPQAQLFGQQVILNWPAPAAPYDGSHVYRRLAGEQPIRLTDTPLTTGGAILTYTDVTTGFPGGTRLFYSYAVVKDGLEKARSAEVEIILPTVPAVATRLLPNVPNPFNPMTEINFQLSKTGQVSLKIYDVTGRLVRELANGTLASGPHSRVWQGRDQGGRTVPSGTYYVRLVTHGKIDNRKIMLLK